MRPHHCLALLVLVAFPGCSGATISGPSAAQPPRSMVPRVAVHRPHRAADANRACHDRHPHRLRVSTGAAGTVAVHGGPHANLHVATARRLVALTFDDGPTVAYTQRVLALLARARAHVTFFDIGKFVVAHPALVRQELRFGDEVANHTYTHTELAHPGARGALRVAERRVTREIALTRAALCRAGAPEPKLFRPPYGRGVFAARIATLAGAQGERVVGWDIALDHYIDNPQDLRASVTALLRHVQPGSIILAHDGPALRERTIHALPLLLAGLRGLGYRVVSITDLLRSGVVVSSR